MTAEPVPASLYWGFSSLGAPQLHLEEVLALAARYGLRQVELRTLGGSLDLPGYFRERYEAPEALAALETGGVDISVLSTGFLLTSAGETERQGFLDFVPWAEAAGARWLRVFGGGDWTGGAIPGPALERALENVLWWRELRAERGWKVDLLLETHDSFSGCEPVFQLNERLGDSPIDLLWDTHHTWKLAGEDPLETWPRLAPYTRQVHMKDSRPEPSGRHPYTYMPPGEGVFPAMPILQKLVADGFQGGVSLEWEKQWHPTLPPLETALDAGRRNGWF
jgi:sugar phosphate isomerase/epimerase